MGAKSRMASVEFVESGESDGDDGEQPAPRARGRRRIRRAWPFALVAVVAVGLYGVTTTREAARTGARLALLSEQQGFVAGLGPELGAAWVLDGVPDGAVTGWVGDLLLLQDEPASVRAVDIATGVERWRVSFPVDTWLSCWEDGGAPDASVLLCERYGAGQMVDGEYSAAEWALELRDRSTGEVIATREDDRYVTATWWGTELLVLEEVADGLELRLESLDGEVRWTQPLPGARAEGAFALVDRSADVALVSAGRHLALDHDGRAVVEVPAGDAVESEQTFEYLTTLRDGGFALHHHAQNDSSVEVFDDDGDLQLEADGYLVSPMVDDGSAPGRVVTEPLWGVVVWDRAAAQTVVELDGLSESTFFVLLGALFYQREGELRAVDLETGEERWRIELRQSEVLGTDGDVLLVLDRLSTGELRGISAHTGAELWTYPLPGPDSGAMVVGGVLLLHDDEILMRLEDDR